ncbi:MAG TPA: nucleoside-diphosphate sugar epimerase/dehydratase [Thermoanaerobaculia bacterium]|nr:nucleoside-diphosphate sugar epimerase/dehydratase [Thermoanaerobaculia bacterium]
METKLSIFEKLLVRLPAARVAALFVFHAVVFSAGYVFAWLLRFEFDLPAEYTSLLKTTLPAVVSVQLLVGVFFGFYRGWWRYVGMADVIRLVFGLTTSLVVLVILWYAGTMFGMPERYIRGSRVVLLIDWAFVLLALFGVRVMIRVGRDRFRPMEVPATVKKVLLIGAGDAGETLAREIEHRPQLGMKVVGFVDDQRAKWGSHIRGIRVYGPIADIPRLADELQADEALIAIPSASGKRIREIIRYLAQADLQFKTIPGIDHLVSGKVHVSQLRPVNVEDLLRRERIQLPGDPVRELFKGKRVLVTGAGGTIGSELASQILQFEPERLALVERSEFALYEVKKRLAREVPWAAAGISGSLIDICDTSIIDALLAREKPQIVLHAAAHKHVPLGEENPGEYLRNNTLATRTLAELSTRHGVERFVFISTDKAINPTSVMGATKRAAEILLLDHARNSRMSVTIVRFGNVIGSSGSVIPLFMEQIAAGGPVTVTHPDVTRYFIRTSEAISLVLQAATLGNGGHVFMLDMGEPIKIVDLARDLIRLSNHTEDEIPVTFTGLRPGEKLFEEIRLEGEEIHPTIHPQIVITEAPQPDPAEIARALDAMRFASDDRVPIEALWKLVGGPPSATLDTARDGLPASQFQPQAV